MSKKPEAIIILLDSARGVYIPQNFVEQFDREKVRGVPDEDWKILEFGPDHEEYWYAWDDVEQNAEFEQDGHTYRLYQNGDLFAVCDALMSAAQYREFFGEETDTYIKTWFERDRAYVELYDARNDETIIEWWDDAVQEAVDDGFLDSRDWHGSALECARERGLV